MRLAVLNGSPRGAQSNTDLLLSAFLAGFEEREGHEHVLFHLVSRFERVRALEAFSRADAVLVAFPLYVDSMPAPVAEFVEALAPRCGEAKNPGLLFLVQSGFPEACHSRPVERWAEKLARRLGSPYLGTIVKGGVEGMRGRPPWMSRPLLEGLGTLGRGFAEKGTLDRQLVARLAGQERLGPIGRLLFGAVFTPLIHSFWDAELRKSGALAHRDARPYATT